MKTRPNFFIVGAPKCGTTSLSEYLKHHPEICISTPKEPHFFCDDFSDKYRSVHTEEKYLEKCFEKAEPSQKAVGDASMSYLFSKTAIPNIMKFDKAAKIIIMLRNPIEMAQSWHSQLVLTHGENMLCFEKAWNAQGRRLCGECIPKGIREPSFLQYKALCSLGEQLERALEVVPRRQLMTILLEDFRSDTRGIYRDVLKFLEVTSIEMDSFVVHNANRTERNAFIGKLAHHPPAFLVRPIMNLKRLVGIRRLNIIRRVANLNSRIQRRVPLAKAMRKRLQEEFTADTIRLSRILNRDLSHWIEM